MLFGWLRKHISGKNVPKAVHLPTFLHGTQKRFQAKQLRSHAKTENRNLILVNSKECVPITAQMITYLAIRCQHVGI